MRNFPMKTTNQIPILFLCLLSLLNSGQATRCYAADNKNEPTAFLDYLQIEAEKDNPDALCRLAMCYGSGSNGCDIDDAKSCELFQKAAKYADKGIASAQYSRGMCYILGYGGPQDGEKAFQWFRKSADQGFAEALMMLALAYTQAG